MVQEGSCLYLTSESYKHWCSRCMAGSWIELILYLVSSMNLIIIYMAKESKTWELETNNGCNHCCCLSRLSEEHISSCWKVFIILYHYYVFCSIMVGCLKRRVYRNRCHCSVKFQCWMFAVEVFADLAKTLLFRCLDPTQPS